MKSDILVIDDEQVILDAVTTVARSEGWIVQTAVDAHAAIQCLDENVHRLILCDILMPQMDGFDLLREVQKRWVSTPVIMMTGYSTMENAVQSLYQGAIDFVAKPFTADEIVASIRRGMRYADLTERSRHDSGIPTHVPCPSRYRRLGLSSWMHHERDGTVRVGATDLMIRIVEPLHAVEWEAADTEIAQGGACAVLVGDDALRHPLWGPVSGRILDVNSDLSSDINVLLKDPYFEGWFYRIIPSDLEYDLQFLTACSSDRDVKATSLRKG